jgi:hypothetical protein
MFTGTLQGVMALLLCVVRSFAVLGPLNHWNVRFGQKIQELITHATTSVHISTYFSAISGTFLRDPLFKGFNIWEPLENPIPQGQ